MQKMYVKQPTSAAKLLPLQKKLAFLSLTAHCKAGEANTSLKTASCEAGPGTTRMYSLEICI
jgi:hypothetical protein